MSDRIKETTLRHTCNAVRLQARLDRVVMSKVEETVSFSRGC